MADAIIIVFLVLNYVVTIGLFLYNLWKDSGARDLHKQQKRTELAKVWAKKCDNAYSALIKDVETLGGKCESYHGVVTIHDRFAAEFQKLLLEGVVDGDRDMYHRVVRNRDVLTRFWQLVSAYEMEKDKMFWSHGENIWANRARVYYNCVVPLDMVWQISKGQKSEKRHSSLKYCLASVKKFYTNREGGDLTDPEALNIWGELTKSASGYRCEV